MNKLTLLFLLIFIGFTGYGQDYLYKATGEKIAVRVIENDGKNLKYKLFGSRSQQVYTIPYNEIYMVDFEGRGMEFINSNTKVAASEKQNNVPVPAEPKTSVVQMPQNRSETYDQIVMNDGQTINAIITEVSPNAIIYRLGSSSQTRQVPTKSVKSVKYKDGRMQTFTFAQKTAASQPAYTPPPPPPPPEVQAPGGFSEERNEEFAFWSSEFQVAPGYGNGYGGAGIQAQYTLNRGNTFGIGFHAGAGMIFSLDNFGDSNLFSYNAGIKLYPYDKFYLDLQFGGFGIYNQLIPQSDGHIAFEQNLLLGPAVLLGYDYFITNSLGINVGGGVCYDINAGNNIYYALDAGIIYRF